jgi:hypothetical protein
MGAMNRSWFGLLLLALLVPACKTAGPRGPAAGPAPLPDLLRPYEGDLRILVHKGDEQTLTLAAGQHLTGACDVAVRIRSVALDKGTARFVLETIGLPRVGEVRVTCKRLQAGIRLAFTGFPPGPVTPAETARIDEVLLTPDAYLRAKGTAFDRPPAPAPSEVASQLSDASDSERRLARAVVAWPQPLLSVEGTYRDPSGRVRFEQLLQFEAVVGTDGRLRQPHVKGSPNRRYDAAINTALQFWRLEPARRAEGPVAARVPLELVFRVY